ncbi:MAG: hypothetical protein GF329_11150 [Candidatus Lokiarchaeota archaeon]|nr:hypothetical protein [Candidatus Lokiarchaeota archaeon]
MEKEDKKSSKSSIINKFITSIEKMIDNGQKRIKKSILTIKNNNILNIDWLDVMSVLSSPISLDFLIDGIPKVYYDIFEKEDELLIAIDVPNISKEDLKIKTRYKTIKIYIKDYLVKKIKLHDYLKKSIKVKNVNCQFKGRILRIIIKKKSA